MRESAGLAVVLFLSAPVASAQMIDCGDYVAPVQHAPAIRTAHVVHAKRKVAKAPVGKGGRTGFHALVVHKQCPVWAIGSTSAPTPEDMSGFNGGEPFDGGWGADGQPGILDYVVLPPDEQPPGPIVGPPEVIPVEPITPPTTGGAPELSTWAMMLLGFVGVFFAAKVRNIRIKFLRTAR